MQASYGYLLAPVMGFVIAQIIKFFLVKDTHKRGKKGKRDWRQLFRSGQMPSSHSAVTVALASVIFFHEGVTPLFAVTATLTMITVYDALIARRSIGEQGTALLRLLEKSPFAKDPLPRVALGHKPTEVAAGIGIGMLIGVAVAFLITK